LAVTALSPLYPLREQNAATELAALIGIRHETVMSNELDVPGFAQNPPDRCYLCKKELFEIVGQVAQRQGITKIADGSNADDDIDYRPGRRAARELGVLTPLRDAGLSKANIRALSRELRLPTADKPAMACLASRFPYGTDITAGKLAAVEAVENELRDAGFSQLRVRHHGEIARIEIPANEIAKLCAGAVMNRVVATAKAAGFLYVTVDLEGYRTGSMNEALSAEQKKAEQGGA